MYLLFNIFWLKYNYNINQPKTMDGTNRGYVFDDLKKGDAKMSFAVRNGLVQEKAIQLEDMNSALRNRLYNVVHKFLDRSPYILKELQFVVDKLGYCLESTPQGNWSKIDMLLHRNTTDIPWYMPYEVIELIFEAKRDNCSHCEFDCHEKGGTCEELIWYKAVSNEINLILEQEKSGYRFLNDKFVNITSLEEIKEISSASESPYISVNIHIKKAFALYSDRKRPDYENSIKESISAVEAMCCIITGLKGSQATLGNAFKKLENSGVVIHSAMKAAFDKLYGYTSDADGIRHGGINFKNSPPEDAKYMLISCSAFVNYLIEKYSKIV